MNLKYSTQDPALSGGPGPVVHVDPTTHALKVQTVAASSADSPVEAAVTEGSKLPAAIGVPEALSATDALVATVTLYARRGGRVDNTSDVWWGFTSSNNSQQKKIVPGGSVTITAPAGTLINLADIYIDSETAGDGVQWLAMA